MADTSLHEHLDRLLAALDSPLAVQEEETASRITRGDGYEQSQQEHHEPQPSRPRRIVNIYLDLSPDEEEEQERQTSEPQAVESTLDLCDGATASAEAETPLTSSDKAAPLLSQAGEPSPRHRPSYSHTGGFRLVVVSVLLLVGIGLALGSVGPLVLVLLAPSATITIVPVSTPIRTQATVQVVTDRAADATANELAGRRLPTVSLSQQQSVPTTGSSTQEATVARGSITFYNAAPLAQTVLAGTLISSSAGVAVVTEQTVSIPEAHYPLFGQATTLAHAVLTGPTGNLSAGAIYGPCCRLNLSAVSSAFVGGQAARSYQSVSAQDHDTVLAHLKASLDESMQAAVQAQVQPGETLLHPLECQTHSAANRPVGAEATQLSVTVSETCTGIVYQNAAFQALLSPILSQEATQHLGQGYSQVGESTATTTSVTAKTDGVLDVEVKLRGTWAYQFGPTQRSHLLRAVAGKSKTQALSTLLQSPGVASASLTTQQDSSVPTDLTQIHLIVVRFI